MELAKPTPMWTDEIDSGLLVTCAHSLEEESTPGHVGPRGGCTGEQRINWGCGRPALWDPEDRVSPDASERV